MAALVNCLRMSGSAGGILICSAQYMGSLAGNGIVLPQCATEITFYFIIKYFIFKLSKTNSTLLVAFGANYE